ncbi:TM59L protein, partial [Polypterus senegalus]
MCICITSIASERMLSTAGNIDTPVRCRLNPDELEAMAQEPSLLSVMDLVSNWCSEIVSSAQSFISSTWTFYLQSDDGKVVVFQSEPEMAFAAPEVQAPRSDVAEKDWPPADVSTLNPQTRQQEKPDKDSRIVGKLKHMLQHSDDAQFKHDFLGCMSRRSGLPRWILAACLFLSIIVMLWLSCASLVTAPDQHIKTQNPLLQAQWEEWDECIIYPQTKQTVPHAGQQGTILVDLAAHE